MENNKLLIANLGAPGVTDIQIIVQSSEGKKTPSIPVGPQSFVQIDKSQVGELPWMYGINSAPAHFGPIKSLPVIASLIYDDATKKATLTALLYPSTLTAVLYPSLP